MLQAGWRIAKGVAKGVASSGHEPGARQQPCLHEHEIRHPAEPGHHPVGILEPDPQGEGE